MNTISESIIHEQLQQITIPQYKKSIVDLGYLENININKNKVLVELKIPLALRHLKDKLEKEIIAQLQERYYDVDITANIGFQIESEKPAQKETGLKQVKNIIAVASGKGGVGKSTVTAHLARTLKSRGYKVGVMDTDVYGPSMCIMFKTKNKLQVTEDRKLIPVQTEEGISMVSMDMLTQEDDAVIWRGPMVSQMVQNFLFHVLWGVLDYLLIDLPPGTGDIQLTLTQNASLSAALIVTTPQDVALADAQKAIKMFNKVSVPVIGIVENMSYFICENCNHKHFILQKDGGASIAKKNGLPLIAQIPLEQQISSAGDKGSALSPSKTETLKVFSDLADTTVQELNQSSDPNITFNYTWETLEQL